ncbi:MAG: aspartate carbamoyltransferase, partial [Pirellulales bacterium]
MGTTGPNSKFTTAEDLVPQSWKHRHLLGLENLSLEDITTLLQTAITLKTATSGCHNKLDILEGLTIANMFFEDSTRTRNSFSLAA